MRIREFFIDRFGMLHDQRVTALSPGLTVILGDNEAGKSTCLNFFRAMLFGYARSKRSIDYLPDVKAVSGGGLTLETESFGVVRLARKPGPHGGPVALTDADGAPRPESDLMVLLRGCTPDLFDKVFAFSLGELMHIGSLADDSIRHALHGAAFGTGLRSPAQVLKKLDEEMKRLFAPRASSSKINRLLQELEEVTTAIRERGNEVDRYTALGADLAAARAELAGSRAARLALEEERVQLERTMALRHRWEALREAGHVLAALPEQPGTFAPDGRERLDRLLERREERRHALFAARRALERAREELAAQAVDPALAAAAAPLLALLERKERLRDTVGRASALAAEHAALTANVTAVCADLGPGWDAVRLAACDLSLAALDSCHKAGNELAEAEREARRATGEAERLAGEEKAALAALDETRAALARIGADADDSAPEHGPRSLPDSGEEAAQEALARALVRAEDASAAAGGLALAVHNAEHALDEAIAALRSGWTRQNLEAAALTPALRETCLRHAQSVLAARDALTDCGREVRSAALLHADAADRLAALDAVAAATDAYRTAIGQPDDMARPAPDSLRRFFPCGALTLVAAALALTAGAGGMYSGLTEGAVAVTCAGAAALALGSILFALWLARRRERLRERAALAAARKRLEEADSARRAAESALHDAETAWRDALREANLPEDIPAEEGASFFARLAAAFDRLAACRARLAEQRTAREQITACLIAARAVPELAAALASLPEPDSPLAPDPGPWLALVREYLARCRDAGRERLRLRDLAAMRAARLDEAAALHDAAKECRQRAQTALDAAAEAWRGWLEGAGLSPALKPETARRALDAAIRARPSLETMRRIDAQTAILCRETAAFAEELLPHAALLPDHPGAAAPTRVAASRTLPDAATVDAILSLLDDLAALARSAGEKAAVCRAREGELPALADAAALAAEQAETTEGELQNLLALGMSDSPEAFRAAHALWERREAALAAESELRTALAREAADAGLSLEALAAAFNAADRNEMEASLEERKARAGEALRLEQNLAARTGALEAGMAGLMDERGLTALLARRESLLEALETLSGEWSRLALAREMLLAAKGRFESERRTGVLRAAGEMFRAITGGAYSGVTLSLDDESVGAVTADGRVLQPETELSRGTREQLYLALRLAYVLDHGAQAEKLPVIMDDIMVNFDAARARGTAAALADLAAVHQTIYFTCHAATADMLAEAVPGAAAWALEKGVFRRLAAPA